MMYCSVKTQSITCFPSIQSKEEEAETERETQKKKADLFVPGSMVVGNPKLMS